MSDFFNQILFNIGDRSINVGQLVWMLLFTLLWMIVFRLFIKNGIKRLYANYEVNPRQQKKLKWILGLLLLATSLILVSWLFKLDTEITNVNKFSITFLHIIKGFCVLQAARLIDWMITNILIHKYYQNKKLIKQQRIERLKVTEIHDEEHGTTAIVQYIVYVIASIIAIKSFDLDYTFFTMTKEGLEFKLSNILFAVLILLVARLVVAFFIQIILFGIYANREIEEGSQYAINQLLKYVIYVAAIIYALETLGINITLLLGGAAALLVGIGLGLQQTFNDFISGIVLLFERSISVGDVVDIDTTEGTVQKIGMRASIIETRENKTIIVPNSKLVNDTVHNWSHYDPMIRFEISVGVAYGSDTAKVKKILIAAAKNTDRVLDRPEPFVRFVDFQDSALLFKLLFFTNDHLFNEDIKSDIRFEIDKLFRENEISIPFPQQDIWFRNLNTNNPSQDKNPTPPPAPPK